MMAHSIGSIREMVRRYREEVSCQMYNNDKMFQFDEHCKKNLLKTDEVNHKKWPYSSSDEDLSGSERLNDKKLVSWYDALTKKRTDICKSLIFCKDNLTDFEDLDCRAIDVLQRSQQIIERQASKSFVNIISKPSYHANYNQKPSYFIGSGYNSHCNPPIDKKCGHKNHLRTRNVVARNFEEIDQILGQSNLLTELSSSDVQIKASKFTSVGKDLQQDSKQSRFKIEIPYKNSEHSMQDMEAREESAIKAANNYLHKDIEVPIVQSETLTNIVQSETLPKNPLAYSQKNLASNFISSPNSLEESLSVDKRHNPYPFNSNKQEKCNLSMSLTTATLDSSKGSKVCEKSMSNTYSVTNISHSETNHPRNVKGNRQWEYTNTGKLDSQIVHLMENKHTQKHAKMTTFVKRHLDRSNSLRLDDVLPFKSKNFATATKQTMDTNQYPLTTKERSMKKSPQIRDTYAIQVPPNCTLYSTKESKAHDFDVPLSQDCRCNEKMVRESLHKSLCLEDGMRQLSTEDLLLALENSSKIEGSLKTLSLDDQFHASCEGQRIYQRELYLSPRKCSTLNFERFLTGGLYGKNKSTKYSAILSSLEEDSDEVCDQISPYASKLHCSLLKSNSNFETKICHSEPSSQLLSSNVKFQGTKGKDNKSPKWMHSLNVRKPTKWSGMSITHNRMHTSAASLMKGTMIIEELKEMAFRQNNSTKEILGAPVNDSFKERTQEDCDSKEITLGRKIGHLTQAPIYAKTLEIKKVDDNQGSCVVSTKARKRILKRGAQVEEINASSEHADMNFEDFDGCCANSYLNHWILGSEDLTNKKNLPKMVTMQKDHCVTYKLGNQEDSYFKHLLVNSSFSSRLDILISEVVHEWVGFCSRPSINFFDCDKSEKTNIASHLKTCSIFNNVGTKFPISKDKTSPSKTHLELMNKMQVLEAEKLSPNQTHFRKVKGSKTLPIGYDIVKDVKKTNVAALASVVQPLLVALQDAQIEESIVIEFETDETIRLLLEKLKLYETKMRALKDRSKCKT